MKKHIKYFVCSIILLIVIIGSIIYGCINGFGGFQDPYDDGVKQIDLNTIYLPGSSVEVCFSDVLITNQKETRKLVVMELTGSVSTKLTDRIIQQIDFDFMKKTQNVTYIGTGRFVVDLDQLTRDCIVEDKNSKTVTIKIPHARLVAIEINPDDIMIAEVKEGLLAWGKIKLTVADYTEIEKELRFRLEDKFNTMENGQKADDAALSMVKEVYEPVIKAIDNRYTVKVEFK